MIDELFVAIAKQDADAVKRFLLAGVDLNSENDDGDTPLREAARVGNVEILQLLLEHGADPNYETDAYFYTALMYASREGNTEAAKALVDAGAHVNAEDDFEESVLLRAVEGNHPEMVKLLLKHGADPLQRCGYVENALVLSKQLGLKKIEELLRRRIRSIV